MRKANPIFHASSIRPAFVDAAAHDAIRPYVSSPNLVYKVLMPVLGPPIRIGMRWAWSPTEELGRFMTEMAMGRYKNQFTQGKDIQMIGEFPILENSAFRRLAGLDRK